ncbi:MAG: FAD-dependent oxidoreductase [Acidobacteriota bacterium]
MRPINRRRFLQSAGAGLAAAGVSAGRARGETQGPAVPAGAADVAVIGAGAFGAWTALALRERGAKVTLLDVYGPGNSRATSGDETRQIRVGYGSREMYSRWAVEAFTRWQAREQEFGRRLMYRTGRLQLGARWTPEYEAQTKIFAALGIEHARLTPDEIRTRWPQLDPVGAEVGLYEPGASILRAREAIIAVAEAFERKGGTLRIARGLPGRASGRRLEDLALDDGGRLAAGRFVFACGPWLRKLFPALVGPTIDTPRREVFMFGPPPGDTRFTLPNLPVFSEASYYGFPDFDRRGLKVCPVGGSVEMDPDSDERVVTPHYVRRAYEYVARRFPAMRGQPIVETRVCQLENTPDEHFLIDAHPEFDNVLIAGGGSGHGFKHGPMLGEYIADRILGRPVDPSLAAPFALRR